MSVTVSHPQWGTVCLRPSETVLQACLRLGLNMAFSCRGGSCHTCLMRCTAGVLPERAQRGVDADLVAQAYFLPCVCIPESDLRVAPPLDTDFQVPCRVEAMRADPTVAGASVWVLEPMKRLPAAWHAGAWLTLAPQAPSPESAATRWAAQVVALPDTHYFLEAQVKPPLNPPLGTPPAVDDCVMVRLSAPSQPATVLLPPTDPDLWAALGQGRVVRQVLDAFYAKVFADAQLAPYFQFTTAHHVASKQYAFLYQSMTGEDMYFGDRPQNAHHAMVISHELFDHRQHLMVQTLAEHGLSDDHIRRWTVFEEAYREHIVKTHALPRMGKDGPESRPDGFGHETLSEGAVCDHCGVVIEAGTTVLYHRRLGTISCATCADWRGLRVAGVTQGIEVT
jgi:truncated hemoglobin YjbI/ferredoxin